jgi:HTH-type transcriptional regulator/antitoxin HigA
MAFPDPVKAIRYHMESRGLEPRDLIPFIGGRSRG